tara:strand:- start:1284 stop:1505 length:222 start_codon:yes stop_codon:yes gene_type:complete
MFKKNLNIKGFWGLMLFKIYVYFSLFIDYLFERFDTGFWQVRINYVVFIFKVHFSFCIFLLPFGLLSIKRLLN